VETFLDFEDAVVDAVSADKAVDPRGGPLAPGSELWWSDVAVKKRGTTLIEFLGDIQALIERLRSRSESTPERARNFYVVGRSDRVEEVSNWIACVLRNCDGSRTLREVVRKLTDDLKEVDESISEYVFVRVLEGAWAKGFIDIYRPCLETETPIDRGLPIA
jgi:hypothetical protein